MTIQAFWMLHRLKRVQMTEDGSVILNRDDLTMTTLHEVTAPFRRESLARSKDSFDSILEYLERMGAIEITGPLNREIMVTHDGWHMWQTALSKAISFLLRSIATPIAVSILTTVLTLKVTAWLSGS